MKLTEQDIKTREVLKWVGLHLFHMQLSSCSQKVRICLNLKDVHWESHEVDLLTNENLSDYFLGINPRGLVPVLVDSGEVHIESNDILLHLEQRFPDPPLIPVGMGNQIEEMLRFENDLHLDLRALSFRFLFRPPKPPKSLDDLERYANTGSGTVGGVRDTDINREIAFWEEYAREGISDSVAKAAAVKFFNALSELEYRLEHKHYLIGDSFSLLDIAWIVYVERLRLSGYPLERLHPRIAAWHEEHSKRPEIAPEITLPSELAKGMVERQREMIKCKETLEEVCFG